MAVLTRTTRRSSLDCFFLPESVAVVGATDRAGSVGLSIIENMRNGIYKGRIFAINPKRKELLGAVCYPDLGALPEVPDLAVIVTPAPSVPPIIKECVERGVGSAIVISAGFKERGAEGLALEHQIQDELRGSPMRVVGPNCLGVMNPRIGLNATFAQTIAIQGSVAFLSQSGALLTAILDWSHREDVGFSAFVSTGSMVDVGWGDLISYYGEDPETQSILLYMESVGDARSFLTAAREVALSKPVIVIKAGRSEAAAKAASSHTGALTGSDEVFDAALARCGVLRVQTISDLFYMAEVLGKQPRPKGRRLMILTNAGGPGVLATDSLIANGCELAPLSEESHKAFDALLPPHWSHGNPIDILGDADPARYGKSVEIALRDPGADGLLAILTPQGMTEPAGVAEALRTYAKGSGKPILASWMGGVEAEKGDVILNAAGIPTFPYPDTAARAFSFMWNYADHLRAIYETPSAADAPEAGALRKGRAEELLARVLRTGRTLLTEVESKDLLALYEIPTVPTRIARSADEAARIAGELGFPSVLKVYSETITHKTDVGGVQLNLADADAVRRAYAAIESSVATKAGAAHFQGVTVQPMIRLQGYELILGSSVDPQFGPVLLFGSGGQLVEVYRDRALGLPPLNTTLAQRMIEKTLIYKALKGVRGRAPVDLAAVLKLLVRFSQLVVDLPRIKEVDINPLLASPERLLALDARVVLFDAATPDSALPKSAIRPYPSQYISPWKMKNGTEVLIRPIRPEDEPLMVHFHESLSERTVYLRYFHMTNLSARVAHERLLRRCFIDYDREMALVAEESKGPSGQPELLAVGRLTHSRDGRSGEVAVLVTDRAQHQGLGTELIRRLIQIARDQKLQSLVAHILPDNDAMRSLGTDHGFTIEQGGDPDLLKAVLKL
jgi:acetyltransferase